MATEKHGVAIELTENVKSSLAQAGAAAKKAGKDVEAFAETSKSGFETVGLAVTAFNAAIEIGQKAMALYEQTIGTVVEASLKFRRIGDDTLAWFEESRRESELLRARIGDALIPVFRGFSEALKGSGDSMADLIAKNQKLIGSKLVGWISSVGRALIVGILRPIGLIAKGFSFLTDTISFVEVVVNEFFRGLTMMVSGTLRAMESLSSVFGRTLASDQFAEAASAVEFFGSTFAESANKALDGTAGTREETNKLLESLEDIEAAALTALDKGVAGAMERVKNATTGANSTLEEQAALLERIRKNKEGIAALPAIGPGGGVVDASTSTGPVAQVVDSPLKQGMEAVGKAGEIFLDASMEAAGSVGSIAKGFATGGIWGGILAAISEIVKESESLQFIFTKGQETFKRVVDALDPLFDALAPIADAGDALIGVILDVLKPVLEGLGKVIHPIAAILEPAISTFVEMNPVLKLLQGVLWVFGKALEGLAWVLRSVSHIALSIAEGLMKVWNWVMRGIASALKAIGGFEIFGQKPLAALERWGNSLEASADENERKFRDWHKRLDESVQGETESRMEATEAGDELADTMDRINDSLTNVPAGVKVALNRYTSIDPAGGLPGGGGGTDTGGARNVTNVDTVVIMDPLPKEEMANFLFGEVKRIGQLVQGPLDDPGPVVGGGGGGRTFMPKFKGAMG
jgi:hypothetical protein